MMMAWRKVMVLATILLTMASSMQHGGAMVQTCYGDCMRQCLPVEFVSGHQCEKQCGKACMAIGEPGMPPSAAPGPSLAPAYAPTYEPAPAPA